MINSGGNSGKYIQILMKLKLHKQLAIINELK